jgi:hypothetical protein
MAEEAENPIAKHARWWTRIYGRVSRFSTVLEERIVMLMPFHAARTFLHLQ